MNHKEIERWYRLRNAKKAAQYLMVVCVALLVCGYAVSKVVSRPHVPDSAAPPEPGTRIEAFSYSSSGAHPFDLKATEAVATPSMDRVTMKSPEVVYRTKDGSKIVLKAETGELDRRTNNFAAKGNVTIEYNGALFSADEVYYSHDSLVVHTDSPVSIETPDLVLNGTGLKLWIEKEEAKIERDVKAQLFNVKWLEPGGRLPI